MKTPKEYVILWEPCSSGVFHPDIIIKCRGGRYYDRVDLFTDNALNTALLFTHENAEKHANKLNVTDDHRRYKVYHIAQVKRMIIQEALK